MLIGREWRDAALNSGNEKVFQVVDECFSLATGFRILSFSDKSPPVKRSMI